MDYVTPQVEMPAGRMIAGRNFEPWINGGYRRIAGYERFDGQPKPSDAEWTQLPLVAALTAQATGDPFLMNVKALLNFDGMADGTTITDFVAGNVWTASGDAAIASGELVMDGAGDSVLMTDAVAFREAFNGVATDLWTIEFKIEVDQILAATMIMDWRSSNNSHGLVIKQETADENKITVHLGDASGGWDATLQSTDTFIASDVIEVALTRNGNDYYLHLDGIYQGTAAFAGTLDLSPSGLLLGINVAGSSIPFEGDWRRLRMTSGSARYALSTDYTPEGGDSYYEVEAEGAQVGDVVSGAISGATGEVIYINDDLDSLYITRVTGSFTNDEAIDNDTSGLLAIGTLDGAAISNSADTVDEEATVRLAAEDEYRGDIQQVPGINDIRGVWQIKDRVYAFRDNEGETACVVHKASAAGWDDSLMDMAHYVYFNTGSNEPSIGDTLTGATSAATGTIHRVIVHAGNWGTSDAAGYFVLTGVTGTYSDTENLQVSAITQAVANGVSAQFAFPVGGRYQFVSENFYAGVETYRVYGANGVGPSFEIDENDVVSPILMDLTLGDSPDENKPFLVESFDGRLWMALSGGSVQRSIVGEPMVFNGFLGAAEFGLGDEVTGLDALAGQVLVARTRRTTHGFYQDGAGSHVKKIISDRAGGILYSAEALGTSFALDDAGISNLQRVEAFGDFASATVSDLVQPYIAARAEQLAGTMVIRPSNQYRLLYQNGDGVIARVLPSGQAEFGIISYPVTVNVCYSCEDENGTPTNWFGGASGYVYQAEIGRNFDGAEIESTVRLKFDHLGTPSVKKKFHLGLLELEGERAVELYCAADLSYMDGDVGAFIWDDRVVGGGGFYDVDYWDQIYWDAQQFSTARFELVGTGHNISLMFYNQSASTAPFILQGMQLFYTPRRARR